MLSDDSSEASSIGIDSRPTDEEGSKDGPDAESRESTENMTKDLTSCEGGAYPHQ